MTTSITRIKDQRGDLVMHITGCSDIKRSNRREYGEPELGETFEGATLVEAIVLADTDSAAWFVQEPYQLDPEETPWSIGGNIEHAPCFAKAIKAAGIVFEAKTQRPILKSLVVAKQRATSKPVATTAKRTVKVLVQYTVVVDVDDFNLNYGEHTAKEIREAVKSGGLNAFLDGSVFADGIVDAKAW